MAYSRKSCNVKANSILESVIALSIISVCLYIAVMIFAAVFTPRTSAQFYGTQNKVNELFFLSQLKNDSLLYENEDEKLIMEEADLNEKLKKIVIQYKDSTEFQFERTFYILNHD